MRSILPTLTTGTAMCAVIDVWSRHLYKNRNTTEFRTDVTALENEILHLPIAREHKQELFTFLIPEVEYLDHWLENFQNSTKDRGDSVSQWLNKINLPKNIRANILGNIDGQATAREILKTGKLSDRDAFRLTCFSCLDEEALLIWPLVNSYFIHRVYNVKDHEESSCVIVFTRRFNEVNGNGCAKDIKPFTFTWYDAADAWYEFGLRSAVKAGNAAALDYFFKQIHPFKKDTLAEGIVKYIFVGYGPHNATMISLAIFHLGPQYWYEFCRKDARCVFQLCAKWPMWFFFSEMALEARNFLKARELLDVLYELAKSVFPLQCELAFEIPLGYNHNDQVASIFDAIWADTSPRQKIYITHLMLVDDCPDPLFQKLLKQMKMSMFVRLVNDLFEDSASLFAFLRDGYRENILCLRTFLYKAFPMDGDNVKVRRMLSLYEEGSRMRIDNSARSEIGDVLMMNIEK